MNTIRRAAVLAASLAAIATVAPAFAQQGQGQGQWQQMTPEQREQRMMDRFKAADTNHDGKLSLDEAKAGMPMAARNFDEIDTGHTGAITYEQLTAYAKTHMGQGRRGGGNGGPGGNGGQ